MNVLKKKVLEELKQFLNYNPLWSHHLISSIPEESARFWRANQVVGWLAP